MGFNGSYPLPSARRRAVGLITDGHGMRVATMAGVARNCLVPHREDGRAGEIRIDLPHQEYHFARDFLARVLVSFKWLSGAVTVTAIHLKCVPKVVHDRSLAVNPRVHGKHSQIHSGSNSWRRRTQRFVAIEKLRGCFRLRLDAPSVAGAAIHLVVPGGINADATREIRVDLAYQCDQLARRIHLWIRVTCKVSLVVAIRELGPKHLCEILHNE